jgi:hypothetical protein
MFLSNASAKLGIEKITSCTVLPIKVDRCNTQEYVILLLKNSPTVTHACRKRQLKWVPSAWGYSWAILSPGVINTEAWSSRLGVGRWTNNPAL